MIQPSACPDEELGRYHGAHRLPVSPATPWRPSAHRRYDWDTGDAFEESELTGKAGMRERCRSS